MKKCALYLIFLFFQSECFCLENSYSSENFKDAFEENLPYSPPVIMKQITMIYTKNDMYLLINGHLYQIPYLIHDGNCTCEEKWWLKD